MTAAAAEWNGAFLVTVDGRGEPPAEPQLLDGKWLACASCGLDDEMTMWADDGEADLADWWECLRCNVRGALVRADDPTLTQNGVSLDPVTASDAAPTDAATREENDMEGSIPEPGSRRADDGPSATRTVLVHLNVEVPATITTETLADDVAAEVKALLDTFVDDDHTPFIAESTVVVALAEEI